MTLSSNAAMRNKACDARVDALDLGAGNATLKVYTGSKPAGGGAATGTLLATFTLNKPAFGSASSGAAALDVSGISAASAAADGTAGWFRFASSDGTYVLDGTITTDITLSDTTLVTSQSVTLSSFTHTEP